MTARYDKRVIVYNENANWYFEEKIEPGRENQRLNYIY